MNPNSLIDIIQRTTQVTCVRRYQSEQYRLCSVHGGSGRGNLSKYEFATETLTQVFEITQPERFDRRDMQA
ncbi:hypothetical protein AcW1_010149 [Taiwanofungus camphoratus]|nr:hypothetical protein AcV5_003045 [Antrodia cinnamomea]KAI0946790.1 hypothetical protein AcW1_010149 [Antrodia cinnamomea]